MSGPFWALLGKDFVRETRSKEGVQAGLVVVLLFTLALAFAYDRLDDPRAAALALWLPLVFAITTAAGRAFAIEADAGVLPLLRTLPVPVGMHGIARTVLNTLLALVLAAAVSILLVTGWGVPAGGPVLAALALGAIGTAVVATLAGALAAQARVRDLMLPVLTIPVLVPLLQAGIPTTIDALSGAGWDETRPALAVMAGFDVAAAGIAWLLWPHALEAD